MWTLKGMKKNSMTPALFSQTVPITLAKYRLFSHSSFLRQKILQAHAFVRDFRIASLTA